jgi:hypothetical protein
MRDVERADAGLRSSLFALSVMDWRRNSKDEKQDAGRIMKE